MGSHSTHHGLGTITRLVLLILATGAVVPRPALAQVKKGAGNAAAVFDDEKKTDEKKPDATKPAPPSDRDTIGFNQENVAGQMNELEERMFRLSEALLGLEPENSSRLRLALKFSREEQILDQMRETHKLLKDAQLSKAETEVKELIAKLEHLRTLLLAEDLDFQLKLARLRQMRETLNQLDRILKEERRELGWSRFAIEERKRLERFATRRPDLESLVRDQQALIAETQKTSGKADIPAKNAREALLRRESKVRAAATALANDPLFADLQPPYLRRADAHLAEAVKALEKADVSAAAASEDEALNLLRSEFTRLDERVEQSKKTIAEAEFRRRMEDQVKNRGATEKLDALSVRLGDVSIVLRKDLIRASASMRSAEQRLGKTAAGPAADDQSAALDVLLRSREEFTLSIERLLVELRSELRARLIADLTEMHELQSSIRETTQAQVPRVLQKSRTALILVAGLSKNEAELGERTEHLLALVEETEFGIALPTTLHILSRDAKHRGLAQSGGSGTSHHRHGDPNRGRPARAGAIGPAAPAHDATSPRRPTFVGPEGTRTRAEPPDCRAENGPDAPARLNDDTVGIDKTRPAATNLPPAVRREVETLEVTQDEIRDSLAKISERLPFPEDNSE